MYYFKKHRWPSENQEGNYHGEKEESIEGQKKDVGTVIGAIERRRLRGCGTSGVDVEILVRKVEQKGLLGRHRLRWEDGPSIRILRCVRNRECVGAVSGGRMGSVSANAFTFSKPYNFLTSKGNISSEVRLCYRIRYVIDLCVICEAVHPYVLVPVAARSKV